MEREMWLARDEDGTKEKLVQFHENEEITIPVIVNGHGSMSCSFAF